MVRDGEGIDTLRTARGVVVGLLIGLCFWIVAITGIWLWYTLSQPEGIVTETAQHTVVSIGGAGSEGKVRVWEKRK